MYCRNQITNIMKNQVNLNCQFWYELEEFMSSDGQSKSINVNGNPMPIAVYNLICSKRDVGLFCKGILISRGWKISPVKEYFGFSGRDKNLFLEYLEDLNEFIFNRDGAEEKMRNKWGIESID